MFTLEPPKTDNLGGSGCQIFFVLIYRQRILTLLYFFVFQIIKLTPVKHTDYEKKTIHSDFSTNCRDIFLPK